MIPDNTIRDTIRKSSQRCDPITIPGVGEVLIRHFSVKEVQAFGEIKDRTDGTYEMVARGVYGPDRQPIFESADQVAEVDWQIVKALSDAVATVNNMKADDAKNSKPTPSSS